MSVVEKSTTFKIEWQVTNNHIKSHEIELEDGFKVCFGVKTSVFQHTVYLVSKSNQPSIFDISQVLFTTCSSPEQRKQMNCVSREGPNSVYSTEMIDWKTPLTLTCWVSLKIVESLTNYNYQLGDTKLTQQLWMTAKNGCLTDVEFQVGQASKSKTFAAHRSILMARSPVLSSLLEKGMSSSSITIDDIQPMVFKHFLRFIYTGQLKMSSISNMTELQALADRYQIVTLQKLCRHPIQEMNASELTSLILSINYSVMPSRIMEPTSIFGKAFSNRLTHLSPLLNGSSDLHSTTNAPGFSASASTSGQTYNASQDKSNIFFTGNALTPAASSNSDYSFPKLSQATGPITFNFGNRTPSTNGASPVIALQPPAKFMTSAFVQGTPSTSTISKTEYSSISSTPTSNGTTSTPSDIPTASSSASANQTSNPASFSFKSTSLKQSVDTESVTLKAAVVSAAVGRLRMIFDELLGSVESSIMSNDSSPDTSLTAPPPSPEADSRTKEPFHLSPPKLKTFSSSKSSEVIFSFPSVTQEGLFGKVPLRSPFPAHLPWQPKTDAEDFNKPYIHSVKTYIPSPIFVSNNREEETAISKDNLETTEMDYLSPEEVRAQYYHDSVSTHTPGSQNLPWENNALEEKPGTKTL